MTLDSNSRGRIEQIIDGSKEIVPFFMDFMKNPEVKKWLMVEREEDFALGLAYGAIFFGFSEEFLNLKKRKPTNEECRKVSEILINRTPEIRNVIFQNG